VDAETMTSLIEDDKSPLVPLLSYKRDELDLVNIVGFLWKWKSWIASGSLFGLVVASSIVALGKLNSGIGSDSIRWTAKVSFPQNLSQAEHDTASLTLTHFIANPAGNAALLQSFSEAGDELAHLSCFVGDNCLLQSAQESGASIAIFVNQPKALKEDEVRKQLLMVLNSLVGKFNAEYASPQLIRKNELLVIQNRIAHLRNRGLELFAKFSVLSSDSKNSILSAIPTQLVGEKSADMFTFLLGNVPDSNAEKAALIAEYDRLQSARDILAQKIRAVSKSLGLEIIAPLPKLSEIHSVQVLSPQSSSSDRVFANRTLAIIIFGFLAGTMLGTLVAFGLSFWNRNRDRIRQIVGDPLL
jgi:hypothetical protein